MSSAESETNSALVAILVAVFLLVGIIGVRVFEPCLDCGVDPAYLNYQLRRHLPECQDAPPLDDLKAIMALHPPGMIVVPAGEFISGRLHSEDETLYGNEPMFRKVELRGFLIDAFEYPNLPGERPVTNVSAHQAAELCAAVGKRLCSTEEWEKACKGPMSTVYQYGDFFDPVFCGGDQDAPTTSGARELCKSRWYGGPYDMSGNVAEWTTSTPAAIQQRFWVKGAGTTARAAGRCATTSAEPATESSATLSFRCCRGLFDPPWKPPT